MLEIVEGEGNGSCGCAQAHAGIHGRLHGAGCWSASIWRGGIRRRRLLRPSLPPDRIEECIRALFEPFGSCALAMLAEGFRSARLETRTKEC